MSEELSNDMRYVCPECGYHEDHYSEALAHPQQGVYDSTPEYTCPICSTGDKVVHLEAKGRADKRKILRG